MYIYAIIMNKYSQQLQEIIILVIVKDLFHTL